MTRRRALLLATLLLVSCRSATPGTRPPAPPAAAVAPWEFGAADAPSQRLYRVQVRHGAEQASLRLVLRVWRPTRFEVSTSDPLGRPVWAVTVLDSAGAWNAPAERRLCRQDPRQAVRWPRLGLTLPAADLAAVLLGRLPEAPAAGTILPLADGAAEFLDAAGQRWELEQRAGVLVRWRLAGAAGDLVWTGAEDGGRLEAAAADLEITWRQVAREPLAGTLPALPAGLASAPECRFDELP